MRAQHSSKQQGELKRKGFQCTLHPLQLSSGPCTPTQLSHLPITQGLLCCGLEDKIMGERAENIENKGEAEGWGKELGNTDRWED